MRLVNNLVTNSLYKMAITQLSYWFKQILVIRCYKLWYQ